MEAPFYCCLFSIAPSLSRKDLNYIFMGPFEVSPLVRYFVPDDIKKDLCEAEFILSHTSSEKK